MLVLGFGGSLLRVTRLRAAVIVKTRADSGSVIDYFYRC